MYYTIYTRPTPRHKWQRGPIILNNARAHGTAQDLAKQDHCYTAIVRTDLFPCAKLPASFVPLIGSSYPPA